MSMRRHAVSALFKRNFHAFFGNPTGYVFITMFIAATAFLAFSRERFFAANLADLSALNQFFLWLPVVFIPAITMNAWAEERKLGTDELVLTLPVHDLEVVLGKYFAALAVYTVSLIFGLSHAIVLEYLGNPDWGLLFTNYLGYWLVGAALMPLGMAASALTANVTVAFILGTILCAAVVFAQNVLSGMFDVSSRLAAAVGMESHFRNFTLGVIALDDVLYFVALAVVALYVNMVLMGRRHWLGEHKRHMAAHFALRTAALVVIGVSLAVLAGRWAGAARADTTAENLNSLPPEARSFITELPGESPIFVQAYVSPDVPEDYVPVREDLLRMLRYIDTTAGSRIRVTVHETQPYSDEAALAEESFGIEAQTVQEMTGGRVSSRDIFLGVAMTCGPRREVIPFMDRGLPVAYELVRSLRSVTLAEKKVVGILETDLPVFGKFNMQTYQRSPDWEFVNELRKQYDVRPVRVEDLGGPDAEMDVLVAALPSSLTEPQMQILGDYIQTGAPVLLLIDPAPVSNLGLAPSMPKQNPMQNQFMQQQPQEQKGDIVGLLESIGVEWDPSVTVWDFYNPLVRASEQPEEIVFISPESGNPDAFNRDNPIAASMERLVLIYGGAIRQAAASGYEFEPLARTSKRSGLTSWTDLMASFQWGQQLTHELSDAEAQEDYIMAAQVSGSGGVTMAGGAEAGTVNCVVIADTDAVSDVFFMLRRQGNREYRFDNVPFVLNCVDQLAGDTDLVDLRNRRPAYRTLARIEKQKSVFEEQRLKAEEAARERAEEKIKDAEERMNQRIQALNETESDVAGRVTGLFMIKETEERKLADQKAQIEKSKEEEIARIEKQTQRDVRRVENTVRFWALVLPPLPAVLIGLLVLAWQIHREKAGTPLTRSMRQV